ncbi:hypothetical protein FVQ98_19415 [Ottowia sp. GY511]|nr:hypothetical protein FVQ98_19415 [Ottowia sp. GY511]
MNASQNGPALEMNQHTSASLRESGTDAKFEDPAGTHGPIDEQVSVVATTQLARPVQFCGAVINALALFGSGARWRW